jgi:hypothetical protein
VAIATRASLAAGRISAVAVPGVGVWLGLNPEAVAVMVRVADALLEASSEANAIDAPAAIDTVKCAVTA